MTNRAVVQRRATSPHVETREELEATQAVPLLQQRWENEASTDHDDRFSVLGILRYRVARVQNFISQTNAQQWTFLANVLLLTSTVTCLVTYVTQEHINVWLAVSLNASVSACFVREGRTLSLQSSFLLLGAMLLVAAPLLSAPVLVLFAAMMVLPLQWLIHRHRQDVTLEMVRKPPFARVKAMDFHPTQNILALAFYTGDVVIWNVHTGSARGKRISTQQPLRSVRFLNTPSERCLLVAGGDDGSLVLIDPVLLTCLTSVPAHSDFVRSVGVHPTRPFVLSCSDDRTVKVWNVQGLVDNAAHQPRFVMCQVLECHEDFVMQVRYHPRTGSSFVSASLDHTLIKWECRGGDGLWVPVGSFLGHDQGVNCVEFAFQPGRHVETTLASGSDDGTIKLWDYESLSLLHSIDAHPHNVTSLTLWRLVGQTPLWVSTCEGGTCRAWNADTRRLEGQWALDLGRAWCASASARTSTTQALDREENSQPLLALGFDRGCVVVKFPARCVIDSNRSKKATAPLAGDIAETCHGSCGISNATTALRLSHVTTAASTTSGGDLEAEPDEYPDSQSVLSLHWEQHWLESGLPLWQARLSTP